MREIKFRAWDGNEMLSDWLVLTKETTGEVSTSRLSKRGIEIMQYTGLKDRNGKEIYEGDIVKSESYFTSVVEFEDGSFMLKSTAQTSDLAKWKVSHFELEVIGNIYENPDLLK